MPGRIELRFESPNANKLHSIFNHLEHIPDDFREPFELMADDFEADEKETFDSEGPDWRPLAASTVKDRMRKGYPPTNPILNRKGTLESSLTDRTDDHAIYNVYSTMMELGSALRTPNGKWNLASIHQFGATINRNTKNGIKTWRIPARKVMPLTDRLQSQWNRRMVQWLRDELDYQG